MPAVPDETQTAYQIGGDAQREDAMQLEGCAPLQGVELDAFSDLCGHEDPVRQRWMRSCASNSEVEGLRWRLKPCQWSRTDRDRGHTCPISMAANQKARRAQPAKRGGGRSLALSGFASLAIAQLVWGIPCLSRGRGL